MKAILSALAVAMLLGAATAAPASAACFAGPGGVHCWHPNWHNHWRHWDRGDRWDHAGRWDHGDRWNHNW